MLQAFDLMKVTPNSKSFLAFPCVTPIKMGMFALVIHIISGEVILILKAKGVYEFCVFGYSDKCGSRCLILGLDVCSNLAQASECRPICDARLALI